MNDSVPYVKATIILEELKEGGKTFEWVFHKLAPENFDAIKMSIDTDYEEVVAGVIRGASPHSTPRNFLNFSFERVQMLTEEVNGENVSYHYKVKELKSKNLWLMVTCVDCDMKVPFLEEHLRAEWTRKHVEANGHKVKYTEESYG